MTFVLANILESLTWVEIALLIFFTVFVIVSASVIMRRRGHFDAAAQIPLDDDVTTPRAAADEGTDR